MATCTPLATRRKRWGAKQWIFAALVGALVAIAVVASISIGLAPAHISFSIASAEITNRTEKAGNHLEHWFYNFTLLANNTSGRTSASYKHLKAEIWFGPTSWIPIDDINTAELPEWQPPGNSTKIPVGTKFGQYSQASNATKEEGGSPGCPTSTSTVVLMNTMAMLVGQRKGKQAVMGNATKTDSKVVVEAKVLFRFGLATTVPYTVRVSCSPVNFLNGIHSPVPCSG